MRMERFAEIVKVKLEEKTGKEVKIQKVTKNNGVVQHGILVLEQNSNIAPTIYLEYFLERYKNNGSIEEVVDGIYETWKNNRWNTIWDMEWFQTFENVKTKVVYRLVNYAENRGLLEKIPYQKVLDLAKVYYVSININDTINGTILIDKEHLKMWGITEEVLKVYADENTPKLLPAEIYSMAERIALLNTEQPIVSEEINMYVAYSSSKVYGAAVLCYFDVLKEFAEKKQSNLILIPSSIHEILILIPNQNINITGIREMVYEVNRTEVAIEDRLSDSVYMYDIEKQELSIL